MSSNEYRGPWTYEYTAISPKTGKPIGGMRWHNGEWWTWPRPVSLMVSLCDGIRWIETKGVPKKQRMAYSVSDLLSRSSDAMGPEIVDLMHKCVAKANEAMAKYKAEHPDEVFV